MERLKKIFIYVYFIYLLGLSSCMIWEIVHRTDLCKSRFTTKSEFMVIRKKVTMWNVEVIDMEDDMSLRDIENFNNYSLPVISSIIFAILIFFIITMPFPENTERQRDYVFLYVILYLTLLFLSAYLFGMIFNFCEKDMEVKYKDARLTFRSEDVYLDSIYYVYVLIFNLHTVFMVIYNTL